MPYDFETQPRDGYLQFTTSGTIESVEDAIKFFKAILACAQKTDHSRVLVDERNAIKKMDQHDCVICANQWMSGRTPSGIRVAAVYSAADMQNYHWIETILQNRSVICKLFADMAEAQEWLLS